MQFIFHKQISIDVKPIAYNDSCYIQDKKAEFYIKTDSNLFRDNIFRFYINESGEIEKGSSCDWIPDDIWQLIQSNFADEAIKSIKRCTDPKNKKIEQYKKLLTDLKKLNDDPDIKDFIMKE